MEASEEAVKGTLKMLHALDNTQNCILSYLPCHLQQQVFCTLGSTKLTVYLLICHCLLTYHMQPTFQISQKTLFGTHMGTEEDLIRTFFFFVQLLKAQNLFWLGQLVL